jgi:hypothetical protein
MPEFRVRRHVAAEALLPPICMRCGAPATAWRRKRMVYRPSWVLVLLLAGVVPYLIVALILEKRCKLQAPFCERHKEHWTVRALVLWIVFLSACVLGAAALVAGGKDISGVLCVASCVVLLGWLITAAVLHETSIHATEITDEGMTLTCVSAAFLNALRTAPAPPSVAMEEQGYFRPEPYPNTAPGPADQYYDPRNP